MSSDATDTLTIRIPRKLKAAVEKTAQAHGKTMTGHVVQALRDTLEPPGRLYQLPGFTPAFEDFLAAAKAEGVCVVLLVTDERTGHRSFFEGHIDPTISNASLVAIQGREARRASEPPSIIPRRDVVGWFAGTAAAMNTLAMMLARQGWAARNAAWG